MLKLAGDSPRTCGSDVHPLDGRQFGITNELTNHRLRSPTLASRTGWRRGTVYWQGRARGGRERQRDQHTVRCHRQGTVMQSNVLHSGILQYGLLSHSAVAILLLDRDRRPCPRIWCNHDTYIWCTAKERSAMLRMKRASSIIDDRRRFSLSPASDPLVACIVWNGARVFR